MQEEYEGYVYFIQEHTGLIKIGWSISPSKRLASLQTANAYPLKLIGFIPSNDITLEKKIHDKLHSFRVNGEWFNITEKQVESLIKIYSPMDREEEDQRVLLNYYERKKEYESHTKTTINKDIENLVTSLLKSKGGVMRSTELYESLQQTLGKSRVTVWRYLNNIMKENSNIYTYNVSRISFTKIRDWKNIVT